MTGKLDAYYLTSLSFEAVPYLIELRDKSDSNIKMVIDKNLKYRKEVLDKENSWAEFNFSKNRTKKLLNHGGLKPWFFYIHFYCVIYTVVIKYLIM